MSFKIRNHKLSKGQANVPFIRSPNVGGQINPLFLTMHYTASGPGFDAAEYFSRDNVDLSAHLVIRRDGTVVQCVPFNIKGWHAGESSWIDRNGTVHSGLNRNSIGIELENWGPLNWNGSGWVSWTGATVDTTRVIEARHKFGTPDGGWEIFAEAQMEAAIDAAQAICKAYGIQEILGHDDISPGRKSDPGPAWSMASFKARVLGRRGEGDATMVVRSPTGLNLRQGPGASHVKLIDTPLPDGTKVLVHEAEGQWRYVTTLNASGQPHLSGWVHGNWLFEA